jgi:hypothetical protein
VSRILSILSILMLLSPLAWAQSGGAEAANLKLKSMFLYNFIKNVDWPEDRKKGDFVVGIVGDKVLYQQMNSTYAGKLINEQKLVFEYFDAVSSASSVHILYVSPEKSKDIAANAKKLRDSKTLVVSDKDGLLQDGAMINFVIANNKLAFEISKTNADKAKLIIGPSLTKMATAVI